jgi:hypothetical protein
MRKESIDAAEEELQWATKSWHAARDAWSQELSRTWNDFNKVIEDNASKTLNEAAPAYSNFEDGFNDHSAPNLSEARRHWSDFLSHFNRAFGRLEAGSKRGLSEKWFGTIKHVRENDPLLQYLYHARNATEHVLGHMVNRRKPQVRYTTTSEAPTTEANVVGRTMDLPELLLLPIVGPETKGGVKSRKKNIYPPPTKHLGKDIPPSTHAVAEAALAYLREVVAEARRRQD